MRGQGRERAKMGKRATAEGSISRRNNDGWAAQYVVYTAEGRKKRKTLYGKTRVEVAAKLAKALSDREEGLVFDDEGLTVEVYLGRWLKDSVSSAGSGKTETKGSDAGTRAVVLPREARRRLLCRHRAQDARRAAQ